MSVSIIVKDAVKKYGDTTVISGLSVKMKRGEFFTLLGPSGCGKTTLLRMIAGFNSIEGGTFNFDDKFINNMDPAKRNIGMVFQNYAIFPNMSVRANVAFGLKNKKLPKSEIESRVEEFLKLMQIYDFKDRMPENLSGGQQQRVALARALVIKPDVLLMDEPLSNLDAKLRIEMRTAIRQIQNTIGITTVYVTHDQEEAMAVSDRIAVMNKGVIQHIGKPKDLYQRPANLFVATFIGHTNIMDGTLKHENEKTILILSNGYEIEVSNIQEKYLEETNVKVSIRPEEFVIHKNTDEEGFLATVDDCMFLGLNTHYFVHFDTQERIEIVIESEIDNTIEKGSTVKLSIKKEKINIFTEDGNHNILRGVHNDLEEKE